MKFINTVELKNHLNMVIAKVSRGETVVITLRGKPAATLIQTKEDDLDQVLFERSATVRRAVQEGLQDLELGRHITLKKYVSNRLGNVNFGEKGLVRRQSGWCGQVADPLYSPV